MTHKTKKQLLIATKTYTSPVSKWSDYWIVSYRGKPDFSKNHIFEKISEIHFSSDCKNFNRYESRIPKSIDNSNLKVLARIIKKFKILTIFKNFLKNFEALIQNSASNNFLVLQRSQHSENFKALAQKLREEFRFYWKWPFLT